MLEPFGEVGGDVPEYFSSRTHFAKIEDKKSYCEKLSLKTLQLEFFFFFFSDIQQCAILTSVNQTSLCSLLLSLESLNDVLSVA